MHVKPQQDGDILTLTIDLTILDRDQVDLTADTEFSVSTDRRAIVIRPVEDVDEIADAEFEAIIEKINQRYGRALQRLAE